MGEFWHKLFKGPSKLLAATSTALFWQRFNLFLTFFWILLIPVSIFTGWVQQSTFISILSLVALVLASQSSWQASRVERKQDNMDPSSDADA
jgi:hypothetical protein